MTWKSTFIVKGETRMSTMSDKTIKENMQVFAVKQLLKYLDEESHKSPPKLLAWADKFDKDNRFLSQRNVFRNIINNPDNNWYQLV